MVITVRNEFETVPAFTHIAGCSLGSWTLRETVCALAACLDIVSSESFEAYKYWRDIAQTADDDKSGALYEIADEIAQAINNCANLPEYCYVTLDDGEYRVLPCAENALEECAQDGRTGDELPETVGNDCFLVVSDHGNVTCYAPIAGEWIEQWSVV